MKITELKPGEKITTKDGASHKITRITPGFYRDSLLIEWRGGWSCQPKSAKIKA